MTASIQVRTIDFYVASHFVPALINGDQSEMTTQDAIDLKAFIKRECVGRGHWSQPENSNAGFGVDDVTGLKADCEIVIWVIMEE